MAMCNDGDGVVVRLQEDPAVFIAQLHQHCPPLARIDSVESEAFARTQQPAISRFVKVLAVR